MLTEETPIGEYIVQLQKRLLGEKARVAAVEEYFGGLFILTPYVIARLRVLSKRVRKLFKVLRMQRKVIRDREREILKLRQKVRRLGMHLNGKKKTSLMRELIFGKRKVG